MAQIHNSTRGLYIGAVRISRIRTNIQNRENIKPQIRKIRVLL